MTAPTRNVYRWPCADCKTPNSATSVKHRCPTCRVQHKLKHDREIQRKARNKDAARLARLRQLHEQRRRERVAARKAARDAVLAAEPITSEAISLYRAEKAGRVKLGPADDFAEARLQLRLLEASAKPKRGRPKKTAVSTPDTRAA